MNMDSKDFSLLALNPSEVDLVIYHGRCSDGFTSALAAYTYFKSNGGFNKNGVKVEYFPASFSAPPPDVSGKNVLICDFSYKFAQMTEMISSAKSLVILDHHKSAERELEKIPNANKVFRMDHSGAYITWKYFYPEEDVPLLVKYVEDNDIWLKAMPNTREVTSYIFTLPFEFEEYEKLLDPKQLEAIIPVAEGMNKQNLHYTEKALSFNTLKFVQVDKEYYFVVHLNSSVLKSEIGNQVLGKYPNSDFSAIYSVNGNATFFSLRSENDRADVSVIAGKYGGGGHRNASGLSVYNTIEFPGKLIDENTMYNLLDNIYFSEFNWQKEKINVVYLNCTHHKRHIGKYLLQQRTIEKAQEGDRVVQQCCSCKRNSDNNKDYIFCDFSCVWNYDGKNNKTWYSVLWNKDTINGTSPEKILNELFGSNEDYQYIESDKRVVFTVKGVKHLL
jgi:oligoribonuclease NrnB/cAMP/cGMP phosphodiesterase (DHH superfamily)